MKDFLLEELFKKERWLNAINKGIVKGINRARLIELCNENVRAGLYLAIRDGKYRISPPHIAYIPKDDGTNREVYVNEDHDRVWLSIANDMLFDLCPEFVHKNCTSYQRGIGCSDVVSRMARLAGEAKGDEVIGFKSDLSKYFDRVPIRYIDEIFDRIEAKFGHSAVIDVLRDYYHSDIYFDIELNICSRYQSLKQGCAVASFLADAILYHIDDMLSDMDVLYVRYSDDILCLGKEHGDAFEILKAELYKMEMQLNPKKVEMLDGKHWFKFLGFSIKGHEISLSSTAIKSFQKEIEKRTIKQRDTTLRRAISSVNRYLYFGDGKHSWATRHFRTCNNKHDMLILDEFVRDCLRAVASGKRRIGGLGFIKDQKDGCICRGRGRNVTTNRHKMPVIDGYKCIGFMRNAYVTSKDAYETLVRTL